MIKIILFLICCISIFILMFGYNENDKGYPKWYYLAAIIGFIGSIITVLYINNA